MKINLVLAALVFENIFSSHDSTPYYVKMRIFMIFFIEKMRIFII